jgi:hypothetical protein
MLCVLLTERGFITVPLPGTAGMLCREEKEEEEEACYA